MPSYMVSYVMDARLHRGQAHETTPYGANRRASLTIWLRKIRSSNLGFSEVSRTFPQSLQVNAVIITQIKPQPLPP
jgi:hypothetical protein